MNNLQDDGWDLQDLKYVELTPNQLETYRLEKGDILLNRTNSKELVGKCEVFAEAGEWVFASYLIRMRSNEQQLLPQFASDFLGTAIGRMQIDRVSRQIIGMTNINAEEVKELRIPIPPLEVQQSLIDSMDRAREKRQLKLQSATELLAGMDGYLLEALKLATPAEDNRKVFAVRRKDVERGSLGANAYVPALRHYLDLLANSPHPTFPLADLVELNPPTSVEKLKDEDLVSFVPMEAVADTASGEVDVRSRPYGKVRKGYTPFREGDILWAKITPCMENGKMCIVPSLENGVGFGSTEFHVLRPHSASVATEYVFAFLSQLKLRLLARNAFTGSAGHQRVPEAFVARLPLPVPPECVQKKIVEEMKYRRAEARRLRIEADEEWEEAKTWLEHQLLSSAK